MKKNPDRLVDAAMIAATVFMIVLCIRDAHNGYRLNHPSTNQSVSVTQEVEPAVILKAPPVQASEYTKVEPELPQKFMPQGIATNVTDGDELLKWLGKLDEWIEKSQPSVQFELPYELWSQRDFPTNELLMLNEIQVQDQLLIWLNQLDK